MSPSAVGIASLGEVERHREMLDDVVSSPRLYPADRFSGRGIVLCGGGDSYFACAWVCVQMLRSTGCTLPIELWYRGPAEMTPAMIALLEPAGVTCVDAWAAARRHPVRRLDGWELKPYAICNSRFEEVLYIDSDNVALRDPAFLFDETAYLRHGAIFWPDRYVGPGSAFEWLKRETWDLCGVPYRIEPEIEAGQLVIDKRRCWHALCVTMHLNEHSDFYYGFFLGDKDTFHLAWRRCGVAYGLVPQRLINLGASDAIVQHDFAGSPLFQHRNGDKWSVVRPQRRIAGFLREAECIDCLRALARVWRPPVRRLPGQFTRAEAEVWGTICSTRYFDYSAEGHGSRRLEFRPDFRIGEGAAQMEVAWAVEEDHAGETVLSLRNANAPTCFLRRTPEGAWCGRWLVYDRMPVMLAPCRRF